MDSAANPFSEYEKKKEYLICVDSDGCAIDSMNVKHHKCFGPMVVEVFGPFENNDEVLRRWNVINLYSETRGINRFDGLARILSELKYPGSEKLLEWVKNSAELSPAALKDAGDASIFEMAIEWSKRVNEAIEGLALPAPFKGTLEALKDLHKYADIAVVSSANKAAVQTEWSAHGLLEHVDIALAQDAGTKSACIERLLTFGYKKENVIMVGDAPGDYSAAEKNGVWYYPICVGNESKSWEELREKYAQVFLKGEYACVHQELLIKMKKALSF